MMIEDTLGNIRSDHRLCGGCGHCRRTFDIDVSVLIERFGPDCPTLKALDKVVCRGCGRPATVTRRYHSPMTGYT